MTTESTIQAYWRDNHEPLAMGFASCRRVTCKDGYNVSIQASRTHYCSPREYLEDGGYLAWELGYPTAADDLLTPYAEQPDKPLGTVYGYVPTIVVDELIAKHGGLATA